MNALYWASVVSALGWIYVALAASWPRLFNREVVRHGVRERSGYRVGGLVHWRLPAGPAVLIAALSGLPILAAIWLAGWPRLVVEVILAGAAVAAWMGAPPGTRLLNRPAGGATDQTVFEARPAGDIRRALAVLLVFGLVPALAIGALLYLSVARLTGD